MGVVPVGEGFEGLEVAKSPAVLGVELVEVGLVPHGEDEAGAVALGVGVEVLDAPAVEQVRVPRVDAVGLGERMEGAGESGDGQTVVAVDHLGASERGLLPGTGDGDVEHGASVRPARSVAFRLGVGLSF